MRAPHSNNLVVTSILLGVALAASAVSPVCAQSRKQRPFNRIVILLDRSGSFESKLSEAKDIAWKYLRNLANTSPEDEAYIIGVDHSPSEIAYIKGVRSRRQAQTEFEGAFRQVTQGLGTDWVTGLQKAANILALPPAPGACHLLVFGDLCVDDAKDAVSGQLTRQFVRLDGFDWSSLSNVNGSMWFVDGDVRDELMASPSFRSMGFEVNSVESTAKAKSLSAPRRVRDTNTLQTTGGEGLGPLVPWIIILVVVGGIFALIMRQPVNGRNGR